MKQLVRKNLLIIIFTLAGGLAGFIYWKFAGCLSGSCPIKSVWYWSTLYGIILGYLAGSITRDLILKIRKRKDAD